MKNFLALVFLVVCSQTSHSTGITRDRTSEPKLPLENKPLQHVTAKIKRDVNTYIITSALMEPFLMVKKDAKPNEGNERFEGYSKDLADMISRSENFKYTLKLVNDSHYGMLDPKSSSGWNGMIGEVTRQEAHIALASLTITPERARVVDFTEPFMTVGISIMMKKPTASSILSFALPFNWSVWLCIILSCLGVSIVLFIVSRFSSKDSRTVYHLTETTSAPSNQPLTGENRYDTIIKNGFSFCNSLWFSFAALMQQAVDICPRSIAGRIVTSFWWFFSFIVIASYTANLAAVLTVSQLKSINSADELARQTVVEYGTVKSGSTQAFFRKSNISTFSQMWEFMESRWDDVMVQSYEEGVKRVRDSNGAYAFLLESVQNEYENSKKPCDTMRIGKNLNINHYGIAVQQGSPLLTQLNRAILRLKENGDLKKLEKKWWTDRSECKLKGVKDHKRSSLNFSKISGPFYLLIVGVIISAIVATVEYMIKTRK